jgi:hypothetical protein
MKGDRGYTMMEALVVIGIVTACAGSVSGFVYAGSRGLAAARRETAEQVAALKADSKIRELAAGVVIPYWERGEDTATAVCAAAKELGVEGVFIISADPIRDSTGYVRGIRCRYQIGEDAYESGGLFASMPVKEVKK